MCGRYTLKTPAPKIAEVFDVTGLPQLGPRYNIAPTQLVLCLRSVSEAPAQREGIMMRWGLVPSWADDLSIGQRMINARSETAAEKPAFRKAFSQRRCLIIADGFFEWQKLTSGRKQPWLIHRPGDELFAMAGLWESWKPRSRGDASPQDVEMARDVEPPDERLLTCTILTTTANADMTGLHDRMPVILPPTQWATWLSSAASRDQLTALMRPLPDGQLLRFPVSPAMNRPVVDSPECILPYDPTESSAPSRSASKQKRGSTAAPPSLFDFVDPDAEAT